MRASIRKEWNSESLNRNIYAYPDEAGKDKFLNSSLPVEADLPLLPKEVSLALPVEFVMAFSR